MISLLTDLLDERINGTEKVRRLHDEYRIPTVKSFEQEVTGMGSYAEGLAEAVAEEYWEKGLKRGQEQGIDESIKKLADYYIKQDDSLSMKQALEVASSILRDE